MVVADQALSCFVGAWGFINATLTNTISGALIPEWHSMYPSGISVYSETRYNSFIITANDTTQPEYRPKNLTLPAKPTDPVAEWAIVAQHSLAAGGPFVLTNVTVPEGKGKGRASCGGASKRQGQGQGQDGLGYDGGKGGDHDKKEQEHHDHRRYSGAVGPSGVMHTHFTTATLPSWVDFDLSNDFEFFDDCNVHVLRAYFGDVVQTVFFDRLPAHS
ncbi:hypothetical protein PG996_009239 [Apiospora saccharicola]|uniref:Lipocalin-like domain-containing protein n=1 Tax=Apiospora saccharicola TaxID=335842 RepID=A0ABR1UK61_9PEZI